MSIKVFVSPDFPLALYQLFMFNFLSLRITLESVKERSRRVGLCEIEFNKHSVKPLELCQVKSENFNEHDNSYVNVLNLQLAFLIPLHLCSKNEK